MELRKTIKISNIRDTHKSTIYEMRVIGWSGYMRLELFNTQSPLFASQNISQVKVTQLQPIYQLFMIEHTTIPTQNILLSRGKSLVSLAYQISAYSLSNALSSLHFPLRRHWNICISRESPNSTNIILLPTPIIHACLLPQHFWNEVKGEMSVSSCLLPAGCPWERSWW